uniref:FERM domain-containing protein n=1 Tax=Ciona intestinalis TaxID=7719 RepID=F6TJI3_CIOIN
QTKIKYIPPSPQFVTITEHSTGNDVFSNVCKYLNLIETDYFGIIRKTSDREHNWINLEKSLHKQIVKEERANLIFHFAVKFYPTDPTFLREEITKYLLCLQIRDDLTSARLPCPLDTLALLSSYWLQSEMGDYDVESDEVEECLRSLRGAKGQSMPEFDGKVLDLYKSRRGMPPSDADTQFLRLASQLPLYGVHRYQAEEESAISIGVGSVGLVEIGEKESTFHKWIQIKNINYKKNKFYLKLLPKIAGGRSILKKYHMRSSSVAKTMWLVAVDHHVFYRV